jgi:hypothetical protein
MSHANLGRDLLDRAAGLLTEHGTVERQPLLEGRNMYIVMAPLEKRIEKKSGNGEVAGVAPQESGEARASGETIGDALTAKGMAPTVTAEPEAADEAKPAEQG